jgi:hypothetical protein
MHVTPATIRRRIRSGRLYGYRLGGRLRLPKMRQQDAAGELPVRAPDLPAEAADIDLPALDQGPHVAWGHIQARGGNLNRQRLPPRLPLLGSGPALELAAGIFPR